MNEVHAERVYLRSYLEPFDALLASPDITDVYVNKSNEVWTERLGGEIDRHDVAGLDGALLERLARQIAAASHQAISRQHPILSATLDDGARVQIVVPPATRGDIAIAIRKHVTANLSLADYEAAGAFAALESGRTQAERDMAAIKQAIDQGEVARAMQLAVRARINILVSGGTSTGKTTFLNALIQEIPGAERLIFIEDTPELNIVHANAVGLVAARSDTREAEATADDLVTASLRMRPDRLILGELRGREALAFLRAINIGHPGSMTTVHADSPEGAIEQVALLILQSGSRLTRADVREFVRESIGIYVHLARVGGKRFVQRIQLRAIGEVRAD